MSLTFAIALLFASIKWDDSEKCTCYDDGRRWPLSSVYQCEASGTEYLILLLTIFITPLFPFSCLCVGLSIQIQQLKVGLQHLLTPPWWRVYVYSERSGHQKTRADWTMGFVGQFPGMPAVCETHILITEIARLITGFNQQNQFPLSLSRHLSTASWVAKRVKCLPAMREDWVWSLGWEDPLEKEMATHSSTLAWKIPWTEEPGRLQSMGSQRVGHDWQTTLFVREFTNERKHLHVGWKWTKLFVDSGSLPVVTVFFKIAMNVVISLMPVVLLLLHTPSEARGRVSILTFWAP